MAVAENDLVPVLIYTCIAFLLMGLLLILFFYFSRQKIMQHKLEKKDLIISHQREMLHSVILTQEEERKRIAQDLHDDISSKLNIVVLNSHLLKTPDLSDKELLDITRNIIDLSAKALDNSRRIAHDLLPPVLEKFGLEAAVEELCVEFKSSQQINVSFKNTIAFNLSETIVQLQVFRILQELMNNSLRHGNAKSISILFYEKENARICEYTDDGKGFDIQHTGKKGLGMKNIQSRIEILNGKLEFNSAPGKGVDVTFTF